MNTHKISTQSDNFYFSFFQRFPFALKINFSSKLEAKGGPFEKMKNKSCLIRLKDPKTQRIGSRAPPGEDFIEINAKMSNLRPNVVTGGFVECSF